MSLVSNEGDSEQNEIRNLQEKLESTMSLVKQLSGQLAELKEQVSALGRWIWGWAGGCEIIHHWERGVAGDSWEQDCYPRWIVNSNLKKPHVVL